MKKNLFRFGVVRGRSMSEEGYLQRRRNGSKLDLAERGYLTRYRDVSFAEVIWMGSEIGG